MKVCMFLTLSCLLLATLAQAQPDPDPNYTLLLSSATGVSGDSVEIAVVFGLSKWPGSCDSFFVGSENPTHRKGLH